MWSTLRKDIAYTPGILEVVLIQDVSEWGTLDEEWEGFTLPYLGPIDSAPDGLLDLEFPDGFGAPARPMWTAWTDTHVGFCTEYDGSTASGYVRRNPSKEA